MQRSWGWSVFKDFEEHPEGQDGWKRSTTRRREGYVTKMREIWVR